MKEETKKNTIIEWVTLGCVILSWVAIPLVTESLRKRSETEMWQHISMSDTHRNLITHLHDFSQQVDTLMLNYNCGSDDIFKKISTDEREKLNRCITEINKELAIMYTLMPDDKYDVFLDKYINGDTSLRNIENKLLITMRCSQFPKTKFTDPNDIKVISIHK